MGTIFPGEGTIYLEQNLRFMKPVYERERVTAVVTVERALKPEKGIYQLQTILKNENEENVSIGNQVTIKNNVAIYTGVTIEDEVFLGSSCVFTNVAVPWSFINRKADFKHTLIRRGLR